MEDLGGDQDSDLGSHMSGDCVLIFPRGESLPRSRRLAWDLAYLVFLFFLMNFDRFAVTQKGSVVTMSAYISSLG